MENVLDTARELEGSKPDEAITMYRSVIADEAGEHDAKTKELAIYALGKLCATLGRTAEMRSLLIDIRPFFRTIAKGKTAKIVRTLLDMVSEIPDSLEMQAELFKESVEWCVREKRTFLKQRVLSRLAVVYLEMRDFKAALRLISKLVKDVKKIDDKLLMVEIELVESRAHHMLKNIPKAKGSLTAARSNANAIYCPPLLQAQIDLQAGILCAEERDYKTGFSYLYEAFEGYSAMNNQEEAVRCLKYMLLAKIMTNTPSDVYAIINSKAGVKYAGVDVEAMKSIADAHKQRSIHAYQETLDKFKPQLVDDPIILRHLSQLYENLLEQNLLRLIEPFSRVQITHVAKLIDLPVETVEEKLSEMILDEKLNGTLDQGAGDLVIFDKVDADRTFAASLETVAELSSVVDKLYAKAMTIQ